MLELFLPFKNITIKVETIAVWL